MATKIHIGTSGWNYKHWKENFYPADMKQRDWFNYYQEYFNTVEINNSFYKLPSKELFSAWKQQAKSSFIFSIKGSRYITHAKKLKDSEKPLERIIEPARNLKEKLGPILFQLPPGWKINEERLRNFLSRLPSELRFVVEFRNPTWWTESVMRTLEQYNTAFCIFEIEGLQSPRALTSDIAYIRLHGPGGKYQGSYDEGTLQEWAEQFSNWNNKLKDIYCYFDNDQNAYAAHNAFKLKRIVEE